MTIKQELEHRFQNLESDVKQLQDNHARLENICEIGFAQIMKKLDNICLKPKK